MIESVFEREAMLLKAEGLILERATTPKRVTELVQELMAEGIDSYSIKAGVLFLLRRGELVEADGGRVVTR